MDSEVKVNMQQDFSVDGVAHPQELITRTGDGRDLVVMSGTAYFGYKGTGGSFSRNEAYVTIGPRWRAIDSVAPTAALAAWYNRGTAVNAGAAVDSCRWDPVADGPIGLRIRLTVEVAVSDIDGWLYRFAYTATAVGTLFQD